MINSWPKGVIHFRIYENNFVFKGLKVRREAGMKKAADYPAAFQENAMTGALLRF